MDFRRGGDIHAVQLLDDMALPWMTTTTNMNVLTTSLIMESPNITLECLPRHLVFQFHGTSCFSLSVKLSRTQVLRCRHLFSNS